MGYNRLKLYSKLLRLEKPIGTMLLGLPCWWGLTLGDLSIFSYLYYLVLFTLGAIIMRSVGCIYNDLVDHKFDAMVKRTASRPIAAKDVSKLEAVILLFLLLVLGFLVLILMPWAVIYVGIFSLLLVLAYPWMKRITYWPQFFLGITFNIGIIMGALVSNSFPPLSALLLYVGAVFWTLGYDTVYAYQDLEDDLKIGVKSTAVRIGKNNARQFLFLSYLTALSFWGMTGLVVGFNFVYYLGLLILLSHFLWQVMKFDPMDRDSCWQIFQSNWQIGLILYIIIVISKILG